MMKQIEEIKNALESVDVSTARGRRTLHGRQLDVEEPIDIVPDARERAYSYLSISRELRNVVEVNYKGVSGEEVEGVELIMEQLESLARKAWEQVINNF